MLQRADRFLDVVGRGMEGDEIDARVAVLQKSAIFASVRATDLRVLATMFEPRYYGDGEIICNAGDAATSVYAVASGEVEVLLPGSSSAVAKMGSGGVVGEYGMFLAGGRTATLMARGETVVLELDYQRFKRFLTAFPESMLALMAATVGRLQKLQTVPPPR